MSKFKIGKGFKIALMFRAKRLAKIAIKDPKLANRIKNKLIGPIKRERILPSGKKVPSLGKEWAKRRRRLAEFNKTSKFFANFVSNATFTGRFLNSFKAKLLEGRDVKIEIGPTGDHKGYNLVRGGVSETVKNADIGQGFIDRGVDYTVISKENKKKIAKTVKARILKEFKLRL